MPGSIPSSFSVRSGAAAAPPAPGSADPDAALLGRAFVACPVPLAILDECLTIAAVNPAFCALSGFAAADLVGRWPACIGGDSRQQAGLLRARFEAMLDEPAARDDLRTIVITRSGRVVPVSLQSARLPGDDARRAFVLALHEQPLRAGDEGSVAPGGAPRSRSAAMPAPAGPTVPVAAAAPIGEPLRAALGQAGDMLVLLGPADGAGADSGRLRVIDCNAAVETLMGVERQAVMAASGALLSHMTAAARQRFLTALRRARGAMTRSDEAPAGAHGPGEVELTVIHPRRGERLIRLRLMPGAVGSGQTLLVGEDISERRERARQAEAAAHSQRDVLVREVHHRIKNNLQGVAGLLRQVADRYPQLASSLDDIAGQVQAIAQVHGLHVHDDGPPSFEQMIESVFMNLARNFGEPIAIDAPSSPVGAAWRLPESEAVPIALVINELGTNAIKHNRPDGRVAVRWRADDECVQVEVGNEGALPAGFDFARQAGGGSGLGLVKAMLPRRGADLTLDTRGDRVVARLLLRRPVLTRIDGPDSVEASR
ncbi:MAG: histidine kinase dimerization/phosphoacceptor domain -containing protein [Burkholderiaceae bacterium]